MVNLQCDIYVKSLHAFSDRKYRSRKSVFARVILKTRIYLIYPLKCILVLIFQGRNYDAFLVVTSPFFLPALCAWISGKPIISLQNDIFPEALIQARIITRKSFLERILTRFCAYGITRAASVVYLCESHRELAETSLGRNAHTHIIPVGAIGVEFEDNLPALSAKPLTFIYCGTLGLMHDSQTIESYLLTKILPEGCHLEFFTSGAGKLKFEERLRNNCPVLLSDKTVVLGNALENDAWSSKMKSAHIGMVFQSIGAENVVFPSKVFSVLVAGQAVLAIVSPECELGRLIIYHDCGWVVPPGDLDELDKAFHESLDGEILLRKRRNAFELGHSRYNVDVLASRWHSVLMNSCSG